MIAYYKTVGGKVQQLAGKEENCWINVVSPTESEIKELIDVFGIEPEFLRASLDEEESSHIENEEDHTLIIMDFPVVEKREEGVFYSTSPIGIILLEKHLFTISLKENPIIQEFCSGMVKNVQTAHRTQFVLHLLFRMANRFLQYLKQIDKVSDFLEKQLRKSMRNKELVQLLDLEKSLVYFQTSLKSDETTLEKLLRGRYIKLYDDDQDLLEDVLIEIKQAIEMSNIYLSILSGTMDAFASVISNNLNIVMKALTSITIVMAIPTMIFSFYGMNIGENVGLPFAGNYLFPLGISLVATVAAGIILYKKEMFR